MFLNKKKNLSLAILLLTFTFILTACGGNKAVGKWTSVGFANNPQIDKINTKNLNQSDYEKIDEQKRTLTFKKDNTFVDNYDFNAENISEVKDHFKTDGSGTYKLKDNQITLSIENLVSSANDQQKLMDFIGMPASQSKLIKKEKNRYMLNYPKEFIDNMNKSMKKSTQILLADKKTMYYISKDELGNVRYVMKLGKK